jgi:predicted NUDIX family NTP pyrophosphohydrolase
VHRFRPVGRLNWVRFRLPSRKRLTVYAVESDFDATQARSNIFELELPPRSGRVCSFPEIDRTDWFDCVTARVKLGRGQAEFLDRLLTALSAGAG